SLPESGLAGALASMEDVAVAEHRWCSTWSLPKTADPRQGPACRLWSLAVPLRFLFAIPGRRRPATGPRSGPRRGPGFGLALCSRARRPTFLQLCDGGRPEEVLRICATSASRYRFHLCK